MALEKEIISKIIVLNSEKEDEEIFSTYDAHGLKNFISFPSDTESTTLFKGNKLTIDDTDYSIEEITVNLFNPETKLKNNLEVIVYVSKI